MPSSAIRYSILPHSDPGRYFSISPQDGTLRTALPLDRETLAWHNITVVATELDSPARAAPVPLAVHALDVNDNVPQLAPGTEPFICHGTAPGQLIQTIWARDRDDGGAGSRVTIRSPPGAGAPQHHCAGQRGSMVQPLSCSRPCGCPPPGGPPLLVPLELVDGGRPALTGTPTLTLSICQCRPDGSLRSCQPPPPAARAPPGSALLPCWPSWAAAPACSRWQGSWPGGAPRGGAGSAGGEGKVCENIISYGGGEADTQAFDMAALQRPPAPGLLPGPPRLPRRPPGTGQRRPPGPPTTRCRSTATTGGDTPCGSLSPLGSSWGAARGRGATLVSGGPSFALWPSSMGAKRGPPEATPTSQPLLRGHAPPSGSCQHGHAHLQPCPGHAT
ncbi:unnamed protein product [Caretta caretta]